MKIEASVRQAHADYLVRQAACDRGTEIVCGHFVSLIVTEAAGDSGIWGALVRPVGSFSGERSFGGESREDVMGKVNQYLEPCEINVRPLDVGFDLRDTKTPVIVPIRAAVTVLVPASRRYPSGRVVGPVTSSAAVTALREAGYDAAVEGYQRTPSA